MSRQFTACIVITTKYADFVHHDGTPDTSRRTEIPIGMPVAIDSKGDVFIPRRPNEILWEGIKPAKRRTLFRDYWKFANINVNAPEEAGPYHHAVLNALPALTVFG